MRTSWRTLPPPPSAAATPSSKRARQTPPQDTTPPQNGAKMSAFASSSSSSKTPASASSSKPKAPAACKGKGTGKRELKAAAKAAELQAETIEGRLKVLNSAKLWREVLVPLFPKYPGLKEDILAGVAAQKVDLSHYKPELDLLEASYEKLNPRYASDNHYTYGRLRPGLMALRTRMLAMVEQLQSSNQHTAVLEFVLTQGLPRAERIPTFAEERDNQLRRILIAKLDAAAEKAAKALLKSGLADSARQARLDTILASWRAELPRTAAALGGPPLVKKPKTPNRRAEIERQGARAFLSLLGDDYC